VRWDFKPPPRFREPVKPESDAHRALKKHVAAHPELVGLPRTAKATMEKTLGSGDRADVYFVAGNKFVIVEVKSTISPEGDICKGVFQCVKYKALLRAHQKLKKVVPNGDAILVLGREMPEAAKSLAGALGIMWVDGVASG
jgi:hypothetical protein